MIPFVKLVEPKCFPFFLLRWHDTDRATVSHLLQMKSKLDTKYSPWESTGKFWCAFSA